MVFSSAPLYLDPHNWHHQQRQQPQLHHHHQQLTTHGGGSGGENPHHHQITVQMPPPAPSQAVGIRPGSMADRARQAKMPQPEPGLKCPRCESTNTKFCYFNNYSLTQPRHFCKMCRRYWTKGGALRNIPVGGGCRRNKRSSKILSEEGASKTVVGERQVGVNSTSPLSSNTNNTDMNNNNGNNHGNMSDTCLPGQNFQPRLAQFSLLASLQGLAHGPPSSNLGLNFGGMMSTVAQAELGFEIGANSDQWRPHHFPNFLAAFDPLQVPHRPSSSNLYHFPIDHQNLDQQAAAKAPPRSSIASIPTNNSTDQQNDEAAAAVKSEEAASQGGMSRSFLGMSENSQYWATNNSSAWTDLSGLNSSTTRLL